MNDYFVENPVFNAETFRDQFHLPKDLFLKIVGDIEATEEWFQERYDGWGKQSFMPIQKCTSTIGQLVTGSNNDINVLHTSSLFQTVTDCTAPYCPFYVNRRYYRRGFLLVDGIYPSWFQESERKDVERAFDVLNGRWGILNRPIRAMNKKTMHSIVYACIILHILLIKEDRRAISPDWSPDPPTQVPVPENIQQDLRDEEIHFRLRYDLIELVGSLGLEFPDLDEE
ncbi:uncharacterized protein LOC118492142 [Helianthus annuus]|uniref:uncharacterized protein LOC118492142 n=1 Tax=Helianthus annuus TaxID=4232 RepID=UPI001652DB45|nr:uncharacterized protein LOC118492142 [Helianthus annuus]